LYAAKATDVPKALTVAMRVVEAVVQAQQIAFKGLVGVSQRLQVGIRQQGLVAEVAGRVGRIGWVAGDFGLIDRVNITPKGRSRH